MEGKMIIAIASTKGGVGKSTLAMQFLHKMAQDGQGKKVMLYDADPQATCLNWSRWRAGKELSHLEVQPLADEGMRKILAVKRTEYDLIFIDVGGTDNVALRSVLLNADVVIVPTSLDSAERTHTFDMMKLVHASLAYNDKLLTFVVLNNVRATKERNAMEEFKAGFPPYVHWINQLVSQRVIFSRVYSHGKTVYDIEPPKDAADKNEAENAIKARADIDLVLAEVSAVVVENKQLEAQ
jgi:chromosome partitioning protein